MFAALGATVISLFTINSSLSNSLRTFSKLAILGVIVAAFSMLDVQEKLENMGGYRRISLYLSETGTNTSDLERIRRFDTAWTNIVKSGGLGIGTGGFASLYGYEFREYPHNVFLEVVLELGVLGFAVLMGLVAVVLLMMYRRRKMARTSFYIQGLFGLWLYSMFNAMVSGDIASNEALWVFGGLTVLSLLDLGRYPSRTERRAA
ncbi:MAG: O-antigen ligase family protein [Rhodothermales bacterium]